MKSNDEKSRQNPFSKRKARDRALILPLVGFALFVPPVAGMFQLETRVAGIPFAALYLFVVWGVLIVCAALLSKKLGDDDTGQASTDTSSDPNH
jgi:hypothetical protein